MHDKIVRARFKGDEVIVWNHPSRKSRENLRIRRHYGGCRKPFVNLAESLLQVIKCHAMQEKRLVMAGQGTGTRTVAGQSRSVGQSGRLGH
ncbi:MAG: hypothetical protein V4583_09245 [Pseudomonadota bacterium]